MTRSAGLVVALSSLLVITLLAMAHRLRWRLNASSYTHADAHSECRSHLIRSANAGCGG